MPRYDRAAHAAYATATAVFAPTKEDARRRYQRLYYAVNRDKMLARAAARRQAKRAIPPPVTIGQDAFLTAYRQCRPNDPHRAAHAVWRALVTATAPTPETTP